MLALPLADMSAQERVLLCYPMQRSEAIERISEMRAGHRDIRNRTEERK